MSWDNSMNNGGSVMGVLFVILIVWVIFGGNFSGKKDGCISNCEVQKQEIIDNARNLYASEQNANRVIAEANANTQRLYDQSARQYEAGLQAELFDLKLDAQTKVITSGQEMIAKDSEIALLKQTIENNAKYFTLNQKIDEIACNTPKRPPYYAQGFVCQGTPIPQGGCGF